MEHDVPQRLEALEIKASYTDDLLDQLNLAIYRQQQQIGRLQEQLAELQRRGADAAGDASRSARDELPPHY